MSNRSIIVMAVVTAGAVAVATAAVVGAFVVVDKRDAQMLRAEPASVPADKTGASSPPASRSTDRGTANQAGRAAPASTSPQTQTVGSAAASGAAVAPPPSRQTNTGQAAPAPDQFYDSQHKRRRHARHGGRRHDREWARSSREPPDDGEPIDLSREPRGGREAIGPSHDAGDGDQPAFFFPFR